MGANSEFRVQNSELKGIESLRDRISGSLGEEKAGMSTDGADSHGFCLLNADELVLFMVFPPCWPGAAARG